ncbi:hypothetical protein KCU95_g1423, partial [Aureobasidium melanogenum]
LDCDLPNFGLACVGDEDEAGTQGRARESKAGSQASAAIDADAGLGQTGGSDGSNAASNVVLAQDDHPMDADGEAVDRLLEVAEPTNNDDDDWFFSTANATPPLLDNWLLTQLNGY